MNLIIFIIFDCKVYKAWFIYFSMNKDTKNYSVEKLEINQKENQELLQEIESLREQLRQSAENQERDRVTAERQMEERSQTAL
jgi:hypothetical protein